jgi:hypothetical protein
MPDTPAAAVSCFAAKPCLSIFLIEEKATLLSIFFIKERLSSPRGSDADLQNYLIKIRSTGV